jgi:hypothetical protein
MASRSTLSSSTEVRTTRDTATLPDGFVPGTVAPFVMRYGTDFLVAMQRAAAAPAATGARAAPEAEPA